MEAPQTCQKCHQRPGSPYEIHYGRAAEKKGIVQNKPQTMKDAYEIGGSEIVTLCDQCVRNDRLLWLLLSVALTVLGTPFLLEVNSALGAVFLGMGAYIIYTILTRSHEDMGGNTAANLIKKDVSARGFDKIWTPSDFKKIQAKMKSE
jgi:hypothetical protein